MSFDQHAHADFHRGIVPASQLPTVVRGEQFTGNGILTSFTLAHTPVNGVSVYIAGVRVDIASLVGKVITFTVAPALAATIRVDYEWVV